MTSGQFEAIIDVHGTFAEKQRSAWWRPYGSFCKRIDRQLAKLQSNVRCWSHLKMCDESDTPLKSHEFQWSGENSEIERRYWGSEFARYLLDLEHNQHVSRYHIVAHSHGGNLVVNAFASKYEKFLMANRKLGKNVFLGTPFFKHNEENFQIMLLFR